MRRLHRYGSQKGWTGLLLTQIMRATPEAGEDKTASLGVTPPTFNRSSLYEEKVTERLGNTAIAA